jgi:hypothetical protein
LVACQNAGNSKETPFVHFFFYDFFFLFIILFIFSKAFGLLPLGAPKASLPNEPAPPPPSHPQQQPSFLTVHRLIQTALQQKKYLPSLVVPMNTADQNSLLLTDDRRQISLIGESCS